jgi:hypothetical protein
VQALGRSLDEYLDKDLPGDAAALRELRDYLVAAREEIVGRAEEQHGGDGSFDAIAALGGAGSSAPASTRGRRVPHRGGPDAQRQDLAARRPDRASSSTTRSRSASSTC